MTASPWSAELWRLALVTVLLGGSGWMLGHPTAVLLAGAVAYTGWHGLQLYRLEDWLRKGKRGRRPVPRGVWREIYWSLDALQRKNRKKKKRLAAIIERFQQAAEAAPDAAVVLRDGDQIAWVNAAAQRLLGLRSPHDISQPVSNLLRAPALAAYLGAGDFESGLEMDSPVDERVKLLIRVVPYGEDRRLMLARDVTRLHRLEQMRRDFVANVSHELRSPLTVIKGYLETLEEDAEQAPPGWHRAVELMTQQSQRMCTIVDDLLALSRLENAPGGAPRRAVDVAGMLAAIRTEALGLSGGQHAVTLECTPGLRLLGEHGELYSAFSNIVFNAVRYTPAGGRIDIRFQGGDEGARVAVEDTGIGIDSRHVPRLTERFYRVDKARSREAGGTGLGLAIVKHVLVRHEARLEVQSELDRGSTFTCVFPASRVHLEVAAAAATGC